MIATRRDTTKFFHSPVSVSSNIIFSDRTIMVLNQATRDSYTHAAAWHNSSAASASMAVVTSGS